MGEGKKFQTAENVLNFVSAVSLLAIFVLTVVAVSNLSKHRFDVAIILGLCAVALLPIVISCQLMLAQVETANNTAEIKDILIKLLKNLESSSQAEKSSNAIADHLNSGAAVKVVNGVVIARKDDHFVADGEDFKTVLDATRAIRSRENDK